MVRILPGGASQETAPCVRCVTQDPSCWVAYVARVLALMGQAGEIVPGDEGLEVALVE
jgi:hypothetical protein